MGKSKKVVEMTKKPKPAMTAEARRKLSEKAKKQWADPNSKIRTYGAKPRPDRRVFPPKNAAEIIEHCVAQHGSTKEMLAEHFDIDQRTFDRWLSEFPDIRLAYERSKGIEHSKLIGVLYEQALAGNTTAAIVLLKFRHNYRDSGAIPGETNDPVVMAAKIRNVLSAIKDMDGY